MSSNQARLELHIDVFDKKDQRALALPNLTPPELVEAILQEFRELEYLSTAPADYLLIKASDKTPLSSEGDLQQQVGNAGRLILVENKPAPPKDTRRPSQEIYLREQMTGKVYKLNWLPAIIGRPDKNQPHNEWLAVNLEPHQAGLRVSRRQALITEEGGQYFIESMSRNPTAIKTGEDKTIVVDSGKQPLQPGDIIFLERSNIALKFIVRPGAAAK
ncbi:MAG: FHA domain-containing protein [Anaerolineae bacterium]|nr:FHA domain-containing protein [Anaerolineae bacterium]